MYGPVVEESFFHLDTPDTAGVTVADGQFCFVGVEVVGGPKPTVDAFSLWVDGAESPLATEVASRDPYSIGGGGERGQPYWQETGAGWVGADVPAPLDATAARVEIVVGDAARSVPVPPKQLELLNEPPAATSVASVAVPASVSADESIDVNVRMVNEGDGSGRARVVVNEIGPLYRPHMRSTPLDPGRSVTLSESISADSTPEEEMTYRLRVAGPTEEFEREVSVEPSG